MPIVKLVARAVDPPCARSSVGRRLLLEPIGVAPLLFIAPCPGPNNFTPRMTTATNAYKIVRAVTVLSLTRSRYQLINIKRKCLNAIKF